MNKGPSVKYEIYKREIASLLHYAMSRGLKMHVSPQLVEKVELHSFSDQVLEAMNTVAQEVFTKGYSLVYLNMSDESEENLFFTLKNDSSTYKVAKTVPIKLKSKDFGISRYKLARHLRFLRNANSDLDAKYMHFWEDANLMIMRSGRFTYSHYTGMNDFTDAFSAVQEINRRLLAVRFCKAFEAAINAALSVIFDQESCEITIDAYDVGRLNAMKSAFLSGEISLEELREFLFIL
ncbi:hypothetical protein [Arcanobacterium phocae]|uniref:hypothetical protein n=1 Tax=Arcanobacterium phocae TaxID=131112 RepID=UPI001C113BB4|nr:hypothetical protein [Arcanobacterium phocae]